MWKCCQIRKCVLRTICSLPVLTFNSSQQVPVPVEATRDILTKFNTLNSTPSICTIQPQFRQDRLRSCRPLTVLCSTSGCLAHQAVVRSVQSFRFYCTIVIGIPAEGFAPHQMYNAIELFIIDPISCLTLCLYYVANRSSLASMRTRQYRAIYHDKM
jgi:hypothetical protein